MNKTLTIVVDKEYAELIDMVVDSSNKYSSRSEFLKDAVREKTEELTVKNKWQEDFKKRTRALALKAKERGWDGSLPTREDRIRVADEYLKKKGWVK